MKRLALIWGCLTILGFTPAAAQAQMVESHVTASNGVTIDKNADDFAGRYEYSAPIINFTTANSAGNGFALVAKIRNNGILGKLNIQGSIVYSGDWQFFTSAVFKGGDPVDYTRVDGDVGDCQYGCTLSESYIINLTPADIQKHASDGIVAIQIRASKTGNTAIVNIPVSYIDAVNEVAK